MAYALPEKQREYQREWARKQPKTKSLSRGTVTWAELTSLKRYSKFETFKECVTEAKGLIAARRFNRLAVATLALRSCEIRHGGDRRSKGYDKEAFKGTLVEFAASIGVQYKTLHRWVQIKTEVYDMLPDDRSDFDFTAAEVAMKYENLNKDPIASYYRMKESDAVRYSYHAIRYASAVLQALRKSKSKLSEEQKSTIRKNLKEAMSYL